MITATPDPLDESYYDALVARDSRFDGRFFVAVRTTGIYCRPICPARKPKRRNCAFYPTSSAAERAGYRPCRRCRPETAPSSAAWQGTGTTVRRALGLIEQGALNGASADALAGRLGVGERHLRRLFARHVGATPSEIAATQRLHLARQLLRQSDLSVTEIAIAAGYGSLRRFNDAFKAAYGVPPSALRRRAAAGGPAPITLELSYLPPYDWAGMLGFLQTRAIPGIETCDQQGYERSFEVDGRSGVLRLSHDPAGSRLVALIWIDGIAPLLPIVARLRALFDLDAEPGGIGQTLGRDPYLAPLVAATPGLRVPGCWDPFELMVRAVLGQQVTVAAARTLAERLVVRHGRTSAESRLFPTPHALAEADIEAIGMPRRRAETLRAISRAVALGEIRLEDGTDDPERFCAQLLAVPGIGPWTVGYLRLRALKDPDAFPAGDIALLRAAQGLAIAETQAQLSQAAEAWRPWRAYAVLYLWRSLAGTP